MKIIHLYCILHISLLLTLKHIISKYFGETFTLALSLDNFSRTASFSTVYRPMEVRT